MSFTTEIKKCREYLEAIVACSYNHMPEITPVEVLDYAYDSGAILKPSGFSTERTIARHLRIVELMFEEK
tara:strand:- start:46 stop:255 length:210 start_codon:yes stop_codon:yes gene_type:complete